MKQYKVVKVRPENKTVNSLETYDVMVLEDKEGNQYTVDLGFYQNREAFNFHIRDYEDFNKFLKGQEFPKDYDITDLNNIQGLIHRYEDEVVYKDY